MSCNENQRHARYKDNSPTPLPTPHWLNRSHKNEGAFIFLQYEIDQICHKNIKGRFLYPATLPVTDMMGNYKIGDVMLHLIHSKPHVPENLTDDCKSLKPSINTMP